MMRRASTVQKMALRGGYTTSALSQAHDTLTDEHLDGQRIFQRFDVDKNGTLNLDEARKALRFLGVREEMLASVIERIDTDADGRVTLEEWMSSIVAPLSKADQRLAFETELELKKRLSIEGGFRLASMNDQSLQSVSERFKRSKSREFLAYCLFCLVFTASTLIQASSQVDQRAVQGGAAAADAARVDGRADAGGGAGPCHLQHRAQRVPERARGL